MILHKWLRLEIAVTAIVTAVKLFLVLIILIFNRGAPLVTLKNKWINVCQSIDFTIWIQKLTHGESSKDAGCIGQNSRLAESSRECAPATEGSAGCFKCLRHRDLLIASLLLFHFLWCGLLYFPHWKQLFLNYCSI